MLVGEINKQLNTPVSVKGIELSLIKKFPNASLEFTEVSAASVQPADSLEDEERFTEKLLKRTNYFTIQHSRYFSQKIPH